VNRDDREEVADGPGIVQRLKYGEVAEVGIREGALEVFELLGHLVHLLGEPMDLVQEAPVDVLGENPLLERQVPEVEELQALLLELERVVVGLLQVLARNLVVGLEEVPDRKSTRLNS